MRVFYSRDFRGHWPVGTSAVVAARDLDEARALLTAQLAGVGLGNDQPFTLTELQTDTPHVVVLQDGDY